VHLLEAAHQLQGQLMAPPELAVRADPSLDDDNRDHILRQIGKLRRLSGYERESANSA
jgi:hypothetical protein